MKVIAGLVLLVSSASAFSPAAPAFARKSSALFGEYGASSTSFYTTAEKQDSYASLDDILGDHCADTQVRQVIKDMLDVCADITEALRTALVTVEGSANTFGDAQLSVDVSNLQTSPFSWRLPFPFPHQFILFFLSCLLGYRRQPPLGCCQGLQCCSRGCFRGGPYCA